MCILFSVRVRFKTHDTGRFYTPFSTRHRCYTFKPTCNTNIIVQFRIHIIYYIVGLTSDPEI